MKTLYNLKTHVWCACKPGYSCHDTTHSFLNKADWTLHCTVKTATQFACWCSWPNGSLQSNNATHGLAKEQIHFIMPFSSSNVQNYAMQVNAELAHGSAKQWDGSIQSPTCGFPILRARESSNVLALNVHSWTSSWAPSRAVEFTKNRVYALFKLNIGPKYI